VADLEILTADEMLRQERDYIRPRTDDLRGLGLSEALASVTAVSQFDYISTVSGGGFVGGGCKCSSSKTATSLLRRERPRHSGDCADSTVT
jgi:hypothetical protein